MKTFKLYVIFSICFLCSSVSKAQVDSIKITPLKFDKALNNPLKGFRYSVNEIGKYPYDAITREYLKWNDLERNANDGIERILQVCNNNWKNLAQNNSKVIPRVYLDWDSKTGNEYWPSDMQTGDYNSDQFKQRAEQLVKKLGQAWDNDSRVAWIQLGIIGYWGEHHSPSLNEWQQKLLGDLFTEHFKNKKVLVRYPAKDFMDYNFGMYWDRFGDTKPGVSQAIDFMASFPDRWKTAPNEGEVGYGANYGDANPGKDPDDSLLDPAHRAHLINWIRKLHATGCGWISGYNQNNPAVATGAEELQKVFGYRYILKEVSYPKTIQNNQSFTVSFEVENEGSAPFYYDWPVELRLLDPVSKDVKWRRLFNSVDIRNWMPGEHWNESKQEYDIPAPVVKNTGVFNISSSLPKGKYILALAILDPAGMVPSVKFATSQYFNGGNHPIGYVGIDTIIEETILNPSIFNDPLKDNSLYYKVVNTGQSSFGGINRKIPGLIEAEHYDTGGVGIAYYDDDTKQGDLTFRAEDFVDVSVNQSAGNSYVVSSTNEGEWLEYTVDVTTGNYSISLLYFSGETPGGNLVLSLDGAVLDTISGIQNNGWDKPDSITVKNVYLEGGFDKVLRLEFINGAGYHIDAIKFVRLNTPVTGITINDIPSDTIYVGNSYQLVAAVSPYFADNQNVTWKSSDETIAAIDSKGKVTAVSEGSATVTVTSADGGFTDSCRIYAIKKVISVYGVNIGDCPGYILKTGDTHQLIANVAPEDASDRSVTWSSSNPEIAKVDEKGLVFALSQGSVKIMVTTNNRGYISTCNIGVMGTATGAEIFNFNQNVKIFPNPVADKLYIEFSDTDKYREIAIFDGKGQLIYQANAGGMKKQIDINSLKSNGLMAVQIKSLQHFSVHKVCVL